MSAENRVEMGELCKMVAQSQTALQTGLSNLVKVATLGEKTTSTTEPKHEQIATDDGSTRRLIEVVLDGQKQLNSRLDKVEELSLSRANDNKRMLEVFEKSQTEMWQKLEQTKTSSTVVTQEDNSEKIAQLISKSQAELVHTILSNVQNNSASQNTNNANNIQITAPDSSASLLQLVDKIAALQEQGENKMEKALSKVLESQTALFDKMSRHQSQELGEILAKALKDGFSSLQQLPLVVTAAPSTAQEQQKTEYKLPDTQDNRTLPIEDDLSEVARNEIKDELNVVDENTAENIFSEDIEYPITENASEQHTSDMSEPNYTEEMAQAAPVSDDVKPKKKKKKKKKKAAQNPAQESLLTTEPENITETEDMLPADILNEVTENNFEVGDLPEIADMSNEDEISQGEQASASMEIEEPIDAEPPTSENIDSEMSSDVSDFSLSSEAEKLSDSAEESKSIAESAQSTLAEEVSSDTTERSSQDWGISVDDDEQRPIDTTTASDWGFDTEESGDNDNQAEQDWEWAYVEDDAEAEDSQEYTAEAIGGNSYIYCAELNDQCDSGGTDSIIYAPQSVHLVKCPKIIASGSGDDATDPYQNSILKD
jgi:hypothetical protein